MRTGLRSCYGDLIAVHPSGQTAAASAGAATRLLELVLHAAREAGLLRGGGKTRTDSTQVPAKISALSAGTRT